MTSNSVEFDLVRFIFIGSPVYRFNLRIDLPPTLNLQIFKSLNLSSNIKDTWIKAGTTILSFYLCG